MRLVIEAVQSDDGSFAVKVTRDDKVEAEFKRPNEKEVAKVLDEASKAAVLQGSRIPRVS
jgi:hypothetical protein